MYREYHAQTLDGVVSLVPLLDELGKEGRELVQIIPRPNKNSSYYEYIFKRPMIKLCNQ